MQDDATIADEGPAEPALASAASARFGRGLGRMTARVPGTTEVIGGVSLATHHVRVTTVDGIAHTEIEETFFNETSRVLEGRLVLPIPSDATLSRLALDVEGKVVEGEVVRRKRADGIFTGIVDDTVRPRDPALLDALGGGALSLRIFPIPAKKGRTVFFAYDQILNRGTDGKLAVHVPLSFGDAPTSIGRVTVTVDGEKVLDVKDPSELDDVRVSIQREPASVVMSRGPKGAEDTLLVRSMVEGDGDERPFEGDVAVVLDVSSAQTNASLSLQKSVARTVLDDLGMAESFVVLACDVACETFPAAGRARPTPKVLAEARAFIEGLEARGAYDLAAALVAADARLDLPTSEPAQVLLLSSGAPTSGELAIDGVLGRASDALLTRDVRILGVGRAADAVKLSTLAASLGATFDALPSDATPREASLAARLRRAPVVREPLVELPRGFLPSERTRAARIGDEVLTLAAGRVSTSEAAIEVTAAPLGRLLASARIASLESARRPDSEAIAALATEHHLLSSETSLLVLENDAMFALYDVPQTAPVEDWTSAASDHHAARAPIVRMCVCTVSGRLPHEAIQRIVRQNFGRMRACYNGALARNIAAEGRVTTRFVIDRAGAVSASRNASTEIADEKFVDCLAKAFGELSFPQPEGGIVTVDYPIEFANGGSSAGGGESKAVAMKMPRSRVGTFALGDPWPSNSESRPKPPPAPAPPQPTVTHRVGDDAWLDPSLHERALSRLELRLGESEASRPVRRGLVRDALRRGQIDRARAHAATWVELDPDSAQAHEVHAETLVAMGEVRNAAMELSTAAALDPRSVPRQFAAAFTWQRIGDRDRACSHLIALATLEDGHAERAAACSGGGEVALLELARGFDVETTADERGEHAAVVVISPEGRVISELLGRKVGLTSGSYRTVVAGDGGRLGGAVTVRALGVEFTVELAEQTRVTSILSDVWIPKPRLPRVRVGSVVI